MHQQAYSTFDIKSIDEERRVIVGMASTPDLDRGGDELDSKGAKFQLPMPFKWEHKNTVGEVFSAKVLPDGIEITAGLPRVEEPGLLKDMVDFAWQSIKFKLARGLSVGWRPIDAVRNKAGGLSVKTWEWVETSAVSIPMNARATISMIKSLDGGLPALGTEADRRSLSPGASGSLRVVHVTTKDQKMPKPITEQIKSFEATRQAKSARMTEIMEKAGDDGVTLDATQTEEYDGLETDVKSIDAHLVRLDALEKTNKAAAKPVNGETADKASASRAGVITVKDTLPPGIEFARYAMCLAAAQGNKMQALEIAKHRYPDQTRIIEHLKAAVSAGTTTDATWAGPLVQYQNFAGDFIEFLRPQTVVGKFGTDGIPSLRRVPFNVRIPGATSEAAADWVGQGAPKPLTKVDFTTVTMLWSKLATIAVLTEELVRFSTPSAEAYVRDALAAAIIKKMDVDFINPAKAAVTNVSPASITNGIAPHVASGTNAAAVRADIQTVMGDFIAADLAPTNGVWIMSATTALALSLMMNSLGQPEFPSLTMKGGTFLGMPVIVSQYLAPGSSPATSLLILVNASDIYLADDGQVAIDVSREASLQMDDAPTNNSVTPTATSVVSLWQTNSIGIRAERFINWQRRRVEAVSWISNVAYVG